MHATDLCPTLGNTKEYISKCGILLNHRAVVNFEQFSVFIGSLKIAGNTTCLIIFSSQRTKSKCLLCRERYVDSNIT